MPQIGHQQGKASIQILALPIPSLQAMHGKRVPQIMKPWPLAASTMRNAALAKQVAKQLVDRLQAIDSTQRIGKEDGVWIAEVHGNGVSPQTFRKRRRRGHEAVLAELALANGQHALLDIHVIAAQSQGFAEPHSAAVQHTKQFRHDQMSFWRVRVKGQAIDGFQQPADLLGA